MNVTREVVTDLLPIYFSGEASGDTKVLVEDYFRQDPDFEQPRDVRRHQRNEVFGIKPPQGVVTVTARHHRNVVDVRVLDHCRQGIVGAARFELVPHVLFPEL